MSLAHPQEVDKMNGYTTNWLFLLKSFVCIKTKIMAWCQYYFDQHKNCSLWLEVGDGKSQSAAVKKFFYVCLDLDPHKCIPKNDSLNDMLAIPQSQKVTEFSNPCKYNNVFAVLYNTDLQPCCQKCKCGLPTFHLLPKTAYQTVYYQKNILCHCYQICLWALMLFSPFLWETEQDIGLCLNSYLCLRDLLFFLLSVSQMEHEYSVE